MEPQRQTRVDAEFGPAVAAPRLHFRHQPCIPGPVVGSGDQGQTLTKAESLS